MQPRLQGCRSHAQSRGSGCRSRVPHQSGSSPHKPCRSDGGFEPRLQGRRSHAQSRGSGCRSRVNQKICRWTAGSFRSGGAKRQACPCRLSLLHRFLHVWSVAKPYHNRKDRIADLQAGDSILMPSHTPAQRRDVRQERGQRTIHQIYLSKSQNTLPLVNAIQPLHSLAVLPCGTLAMKSEQSHTLLF